MLKIRFKPVRAIQRFIKSVLCAAVSSLYLVGLFRIMGQAVSSITCTQLITSLTQPINLPLLPTFTKLALIPGLRPESILWLCNYASVGTAVLAAGAFTAICVALIFLILRWDPQRSFYRARLSHKVRRIQELANELTNAIELTDDPDLRDFFDDEEILKLNRLRHLKNLVRGLFPGELDLSVF